MSAPQHSLTKAVPEIIVPSEWVPGHNDSTTQQYAKARGPESPVPLSADQNSNPCPRCHWNRQSAKLFPWGGDENVLQPPFMTQQSQESCIRCRILQLAVEAAGVKLGPRDIIWIDEDGCSIQFEESLEFGDVISLDIFAVNDDRGTPPPEWLPQGVRRPPDNTSTSQALEWSKAEIEQCCQSHTRCRIPPSSFAPTRLIDVRPQNVDGDVVLRDGSSVPRGSRYCALSYCWGKLKPACLTTKATLPQRQAGIPWSSLPLTFQDAIKWSRSMGIDYLWIDSVCIIQGDEEDWRQESGRMFQVYGNAYVTLVAAFGADSSAGLYSLQHNQVPAKHIANLCYDGSPETTWPLYVRQALHDNYYNWENQELPGILPLLQRAWCYQERLISPRTLLFAPGEMAFQCFERVSCGCGRDDASLGDATSNSKHKHILPRSTDKGHNDDSLHRNPSQTWWLLVGAYTDLNITAESDRLPAFAGVAEYIHQFRRSEKYLSGLWSGTLVSDLLWIVLHPTDGSRAQIQPTATKNPSWSWASGSQGRTVSGYVNDFDSHVEVREAECQYAADNSYGIVTGSRLVLQGRLWKFSFALEKEEGSTWFISPHATFRLRNPVPGRFNHLHLDSGSHWRKWRTLSRFVLLEMGKSQSESGAVTWYMILKSTSKSSNTFVRLGQCSIVTKSLTTADCKRWENLGTDTVCTIE
ncbi:hypothetical protein PFICI_04336 [Pestalotiopsis fici W106-1]|uniref:Heterokaryon incompatibility domain-containing protein n=1 Tax=Pestalotiopsis fici (strain W106-1 / CGMCC3.15140) TaxID=1229662 RepID=W3X8U1_PESFW|nr:uncharacterized protein PFICI_04336 [Pestalotiopsis fici W106-1]ETS82460.1 hypothetical protein PFICI_04336 [Pestalotiopsis fici W106-1]